MVLSILSDKNTPEGEPAGRRALRLTPSGARLTVTIIGCACSIAVLTLPKAVLPSEMPRVQVSPGAFAAAVARDEALAAAAPTGPAADRLRLLLDVQGNAEAGTAESMEETEERSRALRRLRALIEQEGAGDGEPEAGQDGQPERIRAALRAQAVLRFWPALRGEAEDAEERATLGSFPRMLDRYGAVRDGRLIAPRLVIHALYKARFNHLVGVEPTDGFDAEELRAYWGWAATHAPESRPALRRRAVRQYAMADESNAREIVAVDAVRDGRPAVASRMFTRLYEDTGLLRYRNYSLGALYAPAR